MPGTRSGRNASPPDAHARKTQRRCHESCPTELLRGDREGQPGHARGRAGGPNLDAVVECDEAVVVGYLDSVKLQFDVDKLVLVHSGNTVALKTGFPREMFRFQRRNGYRVRPPMRTTPVVRMRHPMIAEMALNLRILDISIGGCALFLPNDVPPLEPGILMSGVLIELDADTRVHTSLRLQHVTSLNPESGGVRLGCDLVSPGPDGVRSLQRYIDQTQKRRRLLSIE